MLCIALSSSVVLVEASPAHAGADIAEAFAVLDVADAGDAEVDAVSPAPDQAPAEPTTPQHHCCPAHCGGATPAVNGVTIIARTTVGVSAPLTVEHVLMRAPSGLERPPKLTMII